MSTSAAKAMIGTNAGLISASTTIVILRIYVRQQQTLGLTADDYLVIAAWLFSALLAVTNIIGVPVGGFGVPFASLSDDKAQAFLKILFILQFWYIIAVALVKLSVLCFYGRLFAIRRFPVAIKIMIVIVIAWLISFLFATFFQVWPLWCNWITCVPTTNYPVMYVCSSVTDIVLDIAILCLPAFFIRKLQMSLSRKIALGAVFGLGVFCVVSSIARLAYTAMFQIADIEDDYASNFDTAVVNIIMWSGIEACASTICACLPCCTPLLGNARGLEALFASVKSKFSAYSTPSSRSRQSAQQLKRMGSSTEDIISGRTGRVRTSIEGGTERDISERHFNMGEVVVHTTVHAKQETV
ncbi:hypothetical protein MMC27_002044 [Xylographa pallens]|nr:hypothetical protein [Xylographa pallens]